VAKKTTRKTSKKKAKPASSGGAKKTTKKTAKKTAKKAAAKKPAKKSAKKTTKKSAAKKTAKKTATKKNTSKTTRKPAAKKTAKKSGAPSTKKSSAKKPVTKKSVKKPSPKKPAAKKPVTKKPVTKKPVTKKTVAKTTKKVTKADAKKPDDKKADDKKQNTKRSYGSRKKPTPPSTPPTRPLLLGPNSPHKGGPLIPSSKRPDKSEGEKKKSKRTKTPFTTKQLEKYRQILLAKRAELVGDVQHLEDEALRSSSGETRTISNAAEFGTDSFDQSMNLDLAAADRRLIEQIDEALERIEDRTYGLCVVTNEPISKDRLEELPWAKYSIEAARQMDQPYLQG